MSITSGRPPRRPYMTLGRPAPLSMRIPIRWSLPRRSKALNCLTASSPSKSKSTQFACFVQGWSVWNWAAALSNWWRGDVPLAPCADVYLPDGQTSQLRGGVYQRFRPAARLLPCAVNRMNISPVRRMRVPEEIVDQIRGLIASGDLRPGDQLPSERELAEQFQVSRASIREALTAMQVMGLLERSRSGGGLGAPRIQLSVSIPPPQP